MPVNPEAIFSILGFAHELAVTVKEDRNKVPNKKKAVPNNDDRSKYLTEDLKLILKLQGKFSEFDPEKRENFTLNVAEIVELLDPEAKCDPQQIQQIIDRIKSANSADVNPNVQDRESRRILAMVREDLLDLTQEQARKFKSKKFKLADVETFYSSLLQACRPLEQLNPTIHSSLVADITRDVIELKQDMDKHVQDLSNKTLKRHSTLEWRYKWASRVTGVLGVAASIVGAGTMFTLDGGALFAVGCVALTAHKGFKRQRNMHSESAAKIRERKVGDKPDKAPDIFDPINAFLKKIVTHDHKVHTGMHRSI